MFNVWSRGRACLARAIGKAPLYQINVESPVVKELWNIEKTLILMDSIQHAQDQSPEPELSLTERYYLLSEGGSAQDHDL
jgi:hypothetical protein